MSHQKLSSTQDLADTAPEIASVDSNNHSSPKNPVQRAFRDAINAVQEWSELQKQIRRYAAAQGKVDWEIQEGINEYRMALSQVSFKSRKLDDEIWQLNEQVRTAVPAVKTNTHKFPPLSLRKRSRLRALSRDWKALRRDQDQLIEILETAPKSVDFYDRIHLARFKKDEQVLQEKEITEKNQQARQAIESALQKVEGESEILSLDSSILRLDDAKTYWTSRLQEIDRLGTSHQMSPDELIQVYHGLESTIQDAPRMAGQIKSTEVAFNRLMAMHDELAGYGKSAIPAEDVARTFVTIQEDVPRLWVQGDWTRLEICLNEISSFIRFYEPTVKNELTNAERRKPGGMARAVLAGSGQLPLSQVTSLVRSLVSAIDSRDRFMRGHSDAVSRISVQIARTLNWNNEDIEYLELAALLHDVGKIAVPETVLTKTDPLSPDDWKTIQMHPLHGARIVKSIDSLSRITPWIYHHQEHWDGSGYPDRLSDKEIPLAARIIGLGEAFTAMTTDMPKRKALSTEQAVEEVQKGAGTQFDPEVAGAFVQSLASPAPDAETQNLK